MIGAVCGLKEQCDVMGNLPVHFQRVRREDEMLNMELEQTYLSIRMDNYHGYSTIGLKLFIFQGIKSYASYNHKNK